MNEGDSDENRSNIEDQFDRQLNERLAAAATARENRPAHHLVTTELDYITQRTHPNPKTDGEIEDRIKRKLAALPARLQHLFEDLAAFQLYLQATDQSPPADLWQATHDGLFTRMHDARDETPYMLNRDAHDLPYHLGFNTGTLLRFLLKTRQSKPTPNTTAPLTDVETAVSRGLTIGFFGEPITESGPTESDATSIQNTLHRERTRINAFKDYLDRYQQQRREFATNTALQVQHLKDEYRDERVPIAIETALEHNGLPPADFLIDTIREFITEDDIDRAQTQISNLVSLLADETNQDGIESLRSAIADDVAAVRAHDGYQGVNPTHNLKQLWNATGSVRSETIKTDYHGDKKGSITASFNRMSAEAKGDTWTTNSLIEETPDGHQLTGYGHLVAECLFNDDMTPEFVATMAAFLPIVSHSDGDTEFNLDEITPHLQEARDHIETADNRPRKDTCTDDS